MRIPCPTCKRKGTVAKVYGPGMVMGYSGPNGERWPQELCQTCGGTGWIENQTPVKTDAEIATEHTATVIRKASQS